jgi:hypothetical protein
MAIACACTGRAPASIACACTGRASIEAGRVLSIAGKDGDSSYQKNLLRLLCLLASASASPALQAVGESLMAMPSKWAGAISNQWG